MKTAFDFQYFITSIPFIAKGIPIALLIACISFVIGLAIGLIVALLRLYHVRGLTQAASLYVSFIRGTPLLIQIFLTYYGAPVLFKSIGMGSLISYIPPIYFIYFAFSLNSGAYLSETIRGAILAVPRGQFNASYALGMTTPQVMRSIILPQALIVALPNLGNHFIILLKETSLAFIVSVPEIMGQAKIIAGRTSQFFEVYIAAALLYWSICLIVEKILKKIDVLINRHQPCLQ